MAEGSSAGQAFLALSWQGSLAKHERRKARAEPVTVNFLSFFFFACFEPLSCIPPLSQKMRQGESRQSCVRACVSLAYFELHACTLYIGLVLSQGLLVASRSNRNATVIVEFRTQVRMKVNRHAPFACLCSQFKCWSRAAFGLKFFNLSEAQGLQRQSFWCCKIGNLSVGPAFCGGNYSSQKDTDLSC